VVEVAGGKEETASQDVEPRGGEKAEEEEPAARDTEEGQAQSEQAETENQASRLGYGGGGGGAWWQKRVDTSALIGPLGEFLKGRTRMEEACE
jgi:hypothetical protein